MPASIEKILTFSIFLTLLVISFLIFQPYFAAIMASLVLAYLFYPAYLLLNEKLIKNKNISAFIICLFAILVFVIFFWLILQITVKQVVDFYAYTQKFDMTAPIKALVAKISNVQSFYVQTSFFIDKGIEKIASLVLNFSSQIFLNLPVIILQIFVSFFVMFYFLRDGKEIVESLRSILPFKENFKNRFFQRFREVTHGVIYGLGIVGIIQGFAAGVGFYLFGVKGAFILMLASMILSIIPFLGSWLIYIPVGLIMIANGDINGLWLIVYGIVFVSHIDNLIRPYIIGKKAKISNVLALIGMLGGIQIFGVIGLIIGPLILDYTLIFIQSYKEGKISEVV